MQIAQKNFYKKFLGRAGEIKAIDFLKKKGYKISIKLSEEYSLYRQNYCGWIYTKKKRMEKTGCEDNKKTVS